jgi:hypothetical protein
MRQATTKLSLALLPTRVVGHLSNWALRALFLVGVQLALVGQAPAAPVVFTASGEFENGWELSGTVTIDTASGKVLSADLSVTEGSVVQFVFDKVSHVVDYSYRGPVTGIGITEGPIVPCLGITVPGKSLVGYNGSSILTSGFELLSYIEIGEGLNYVDRLPLNFGSLGPTK